jgi:hypothetical protein
LHPPNAPPVSGQRGHLAVAVRLVAFSATAGLLLAAAVHAMDAGGGGRTTESSVALPRSPSAFAARVPQSPFDELDMLDSSIRAPLPCQRDAATHPALAMPGLSAFGAAELLLRCAGP